MSETPVVLVLVFTRLCAAASRCVWSCVLGEGTLCMRRTQFRDTDAHECARSHGALVCTLRVSRRALCETARARARVHASVRSRVAVCVVLCLFSRRDTV